MAGSDNQPPAIVVHAVDHFDVVAKKNAYVVHWVYNRREVRRSSQKGRHVLE
jgi:hypothetical protein